MSLYTYNDIHLLPPPPRSVLSLGPESSRARLPDFETVQQLSQFVERFFVYDMSTMPAVRIHIIFSAAFVCFLVLVAFGILVQRMYDQSFWIIRIIKRPTGSVLIPNSIICFALVEGVFGACFVTMMWYMYCTFYTKTVPARFQPAWFLLPWCPLIIGAVWAAWGMFFATPIPLQQIYARPGRLRTLFSHAWFTNSVGVVTPLIMCATIVFPCLKAMIVWTKAFHQHLSWQTTYAEQPTFTQEMVQEAQLIWFECLFAFRIVSATFVVWTLWAFSVFLGYTWTATRLIHVIKKETSKMKDFGPRSGIAVVTRGGGGGRELSTFFTTKSNTNKAPIKQQSSFNELKASHDALSLRSSVKTNLAGVNELTKARTTDAEVKRAPLWKRIPIPNVILQSNNERMLIPGRQLRRDQVSQLNKAMIHIFIQVCAISPACLCLTMVSLLLAIFAFSSFEHPHNGGTYIELVAQVATIAIDWIVCVFGGVTIVALAQRTYEHMFSHVQVNAQSHAISMNNGPSNEPSSGRRPLDVLTLDILSELEEIDDLSGDGRSTSANDSEDQLGHRHSTYVTPRRQQSLTPHSISRPRDVLHRGSVSLTQKPIFTQYVRRQTGGTTAQPFALEDESCIDHMLFQPDQHITDGQGVQIERTTVVVRDRRINSMSFDYD